MNPPNTPPYVVGPDGKTLGFYDANGNFFPSNAMTQYGDPYLNQGMGNKAYPLDMFQTHASPYATEGIVRQYSNPFTPKPVDATVEALKNSLMQAQANQLVQQTVTQPQTTTTDAQDISSISDALNNAEIIPSDGTAAGGKKMTPGARNALIGLGANAVTALAGVAAPNQYNPRVGMEKPGLGQFGNLTFTGMGASLGPAGAAAGFGVDMLKNTIGYFKHKQQYNAAENKADFMDWRNKLMQNQMPDYTGLARDGMEANESDGDADDLVPIEIERNERIYKKTPYGYTMIGQTGPNHPTHEEGGVQVSVPVGSLVFPEKYFGELDKAEQHGMQFGDWTLFDNVKEKMKKNAKEAYYQGKPYSTGGKP